MRRRRIVARSSRRALPALLIVIVGLGLAACRGTSGGETPGEGTPVADRVAPVEATPALLPTPTLA